MCIAHCCIPRPQNVHCALLHTQTAKHHGCNELVHCCMPRPQSILFILLPWLIHECRCLIVGTRYLHCYLKIRYIHGALRSGYATIRNAQCNNSEDNLFLIRWILTLKLAGGGFVEPPRFFSLKFLPLDQLPNAFAKLFLDNEDIFWH